MKAHLQHSRGGHSSGPIRASRFTSSTPPCKTLRGTLLKTSEDEIVIQRNTRVPVSPEVIPMHDVARVVVEPINSSNGKLMAPARRSAWCG